MDNHYHIFLETAEANLSRGMWQLNGVYTQRFNRKHNRVGHVFQGRYKAILVERMLGFVGKEYSFGEIPKAQCRPAAQEISHYIETANTRNEAICLAYQSGGYSMAAIGEHFDLHYSRVSRIINDAKGKA